MGRLEVADGRQRQARQQRQGGSKGGD